MTLRPNHKTPLSRIAYAPGFAATCPGHLAAILAHAWARTKTFGPPIDQGPMS